MTKDTEPRSAVTWCGDPTVRLCQFMVASFL